MEVVLGMLFLILDSADLLFAKKKLVVRTYTAAEALPTTKRVELIDKNELAAAALCEDSETFVVHVEAIMGALKMTIHLSREAQITLLKVEEVSEATVPSARFEYLDYVNVFSPDSAAELLENTGINYHLINRIDDK